MQECHEAMESALEPLERRILELMAVGMSSGAVADQMGLSVPEVRKHLGSLITRLGAHSRLEAIIIAIRRGLIHLPTS